MNRQIVMAIMAQAMLALADGKITVDEIKGMVSTLAKMAGFDQSDFHEVFIESDGDLHFVLKKSCLDKLHIEL